jgi:outer membrane protein assembly factor BamB
LRDLKKNAGSGAKAICTASLVGTNLICPYNKFVYDLNAVSGTLVWRSPAGASNFVASPAVSDAPGNQVIFAGDEGGIEHAFSLSSGAPLLSAAGGFSIASSTAISGGRVFFGGVDGYVYAYG